MVKANHVPSGEEISQAIASNLKQYDGPVNAKIVQQMLSKEHPNWKLPERRVNKFLKRHMNKSKNVAGADDDDTVQADSKGSSGRGGSFKSFSRLFGRKSSKKVSKPPAAEPEPEPVKEPEPEPPVAEPIPEAVEETPEPIIEEKDTPDVYEDDNSVNNNKCECNACSIM